VNVTARRRSASTRSASTLLREPEKETAESGATPMRWIVVANENRARIITVTRGRVRELCRMPVDDAAKLVERACAQQRLTEVATVMEDEHLVAFRAQLFSAAAAVRVHVRLPMFDAAVEEIEGRVAWAAFQRDRPQTHW
jgi:hypothetical protein